jgi:hypothetical protein
MMHIHYTPIIALNAYMHVFMVWWMCKTSTPQGLFVVSSSTVGPNKQLITKHAYLSNTRPLASNPNDGNTPLTVRNHTVEEQAEIECPRPQIEREVSAM